MKMFDVEYTVMVSKTWDFPPEGDWDSEASHDMEFIGFRGEESRPIAEACYHAVGKMLMQVPDFPDKIQTDDSLSDVRESNPYYGNFTVFDEHTDTVYEVSIFRQYAVGL